jgi:hypothetical protein
VTSTDQKNSDYPSPLTGVNSVEHLRVAIHRVFKVTGSNIAFGERALDLADRLFRGEIWNSQPSSLHYHDFSHTIQASYCFLDLVAGHARVESVKLAPREVELGLAGILLHDSGYLKVSGDNDGTGAKYTYSHVLRSCGLAASLLPLIGCRLNEITLVIDAISCTGISGNPYSVNFPSDNSRVIGCMIATADYLGQMAALEYPEKLPHLFNEFTEADDFNNVPFEQRAFPSVSAMLAATPSFWTSFVRPKMDADFGSVHKYLCLPDRPDYNPYIAAVEKNVLRISAELKKNAKPIAPR